VITLKVDVVIPVYNQVKSLAFVLKGFLNQITEHELTIIIVDDGSTDDINGLVTENQSYFIKKGWELKYVWQKNSGRAIARNLGVKSGYGEIVIFCDADRIPGQHFVNSHVNRLLKEKDIVIGNPLEIYLGSILERESLIWEIIHGKKFRLARTSSFSKIVLKIYSNDGYTDSAIPWVSTFSGNMSIFRNAIEKNKFDEGFKLWGFENIELGYRLFSKGYNFIFEEKAVNYHLNHPRPSNFYQKGISESRRYLSLHYGEESPIAKFGDLAEGKMSLHEFEEEFGNEKASWLNKIEGELINKMSPLEK